MPQHNSGLSAVIQQQDQGPDLTALAQMVMHMKEQKKSDALQSLEMMNKMVQQGLPVDPSAYEKAAKGFEKAYGLKFSENGGAPQQAATGQGAAPGRLPTQTAAAPITPQQGSAIQAVGQAGAQPSGAQSATPVSPQSAKAYPAGGMQPPLQGGNMYENYINQVRRQAQAKSLDETKTAELNSKLSELKTAALSGDEGAKQQLISMGQITWNAEYDRVQAMKKDDPKGYAAEMSATHDRALGLETPQQKDQRRSAFVTSLVASGYTPEQANQEFEKPGSSGMKKSMKQLSDEAGYYAQLAESFGDEGARKIAPQLAAGASLSEILPNIGDYQSKFAQQMAAQKTQHEEDLKVRQDEVKVQNRLAGIQAERLDFDKEMGAERLQNLSDRVQLELQKQENVAFSANMSDMVSAVKGGVKVPKEVMDRYVDELGRRAGITRLESQSWLNYLTLGALGQADKWAPDVEAGKRLLDKLVPGQTPTAPAPFTSHSSSSVGEEELRKVTREETQRKAGTFFAPQDPGLQQFMQILGASRGPNIIGGKK